MNSPRRTHLVLTAAVLLALAGVARAGEPEVVTTAAPGGPGAPSSVADQIDTYLKTSPALVLPKDAASGVTATDAPRRVHGVVDLAVGTGGYRSAYVASEIPVGKTGTATIAVGQTRFNDRGWNGLGYRGGPATSQTLALGLALGATEPVDWRCRRAMESIADAHLDGGPPGACRAHQPPPGP